MSSKLERWITLAPVTTAWLRTGKRHPPRTELVCLWTEYGRLRA